MDVALFSHKLIKHITILVIGYYICLRENSFPAMLMSFFNSFAQTFFFHLTLNITQLYGKIAVSPYIMFIGSILLTTLLLRGWGGLKLSTMGDSSLYFNPLNASICKCYKRWRKLSIDHILEPVCCKKR